MKGKIMPMGFHSIYEYYEKYMEAVSIYLEEYLAYMNEFPDSNSPIDKYKGIAVSKEQAKKFMRFGYFRISAEGEEKCDAVLSEIDDMAAQTDIFLPFEYILNIFSLGQIDRLALAACFLLPFYPKLSKTYGYINDNVNMSGLSLASVCDIFWYGNIGKAYEAKRGYLSFLFDFDDSQTDFSFIELKPDKRMLDLLIGMELIYNLPYSQTFTVIDDLEPIYGRESELQQIENLLDMPENYILCMSGAFGREFIVKHMARRKRCNVIFVNVSQISITESDRAAVQLKREIKLQSAYICLTQINNDNIKIAEKLSIYLSKFSKLIFVCTDIDMLSGVKNSIKLKMIDLDFENKLNIWNSFEMPLEDFSVEDIAASYKFSPGNIKEVISQCRIRAALTQKECIDRHIVEEICLEKVKDILKGKAIRLQTNFSLDDLILPEEEKEQIREGMLHIRYAHKVYDTWGFSEKIAYGRGISMLFEGPPGTGKTMAASIIGNETGLPVFKIDISKMVSKYIGETEKSLGEIFDIAQKNNAVLFFDETDALFGKRSDIKDSHDKYANIETSFLLQKMEEYDGIIIMATNLKHNIDEAFIRRINYIIHFPFPGPNERMRLWKSVIPHGTPAEKDIDFKFLAENFEMTGAMIKSTVLSAAFLAAGKGEPVSMMDILRSTKKQFAKFGKNLTANDFGPYGMLLDYR